MPSQLMSLIPLMGMWVMFGLGYVVKLLIDRQRYARQADGHVLVEKIPTAGKAEFELIPIEEIGGETCIRYPRKGDRGKWPIHFLARHTRIPVAFPINKIHFVQTTIDMVVFLANDVEPLSNLSGVPVVSAQHTSAVLQGVALAVDETLRHVKAESGEIGKSKFGLLWVYVLLGISIAVGIVAMVLIMSQTGILDKIKESIIQLQSQAGLR